MEALLILGLVLGGLVLLLGVGLLSLGSNEARLAMRFHPSLEVTAPSRLKAKHRGQRVRVRGTIASDEVEGPFSGERLRYVLAEVTRVQRVPRREHPLPLRQRPKKTLELLSEGGARVAVSFGDRGRRLLCRQSWGPEPWHWRDSERDHRLKAVFGELYPQLTVSEGSKEHYLLSEQWLGQDTPVTITGEVKQVDALSQGRRVVLVAPEDGELLLTDLDDDEIVALGQRSARAGRWGRLALVLGGCTFFAGLMGILFG